MPTYFPMCLGYGQPVFYSNIAAPMPPNMVTHLHQNYPNFENIQVWNYILSNKISPHCMISAWIWISAAIWWWAKSHISHDPIQSSTFSCDASTGQFSFLLGYHLLPQRPKPPINAYSLTPKPKQIPSRGSAHPGFRTFHAYSQGSTSQPVETLTSALANASPSEQRSVRTSLHLLAWLLQKVPNLGIIFVCRCWERIYSLLFSSWCLKWLWKWLACCWKWIKLRFCICLNRLSLLELKLCRLWMPSKRLLPIIPFEQLPLLLLSLWFLQTIFGFQTFFCQCLSSTISSLVLVDCYSWQFYQAIYINILACFRWICTPSSSCSFSLSLIAFAQN